MSMEKHNVVELQRTPADEKDRADGDWDKAAADLFTSIKDEVADLDNIAVPNLTDVEGE